MTENYFELRCAVVKVNKNVIMKANEKINAFFSRAKDVKEAFTQKFLSSKSNQTDSLDEADADDGNLVIESDQKAAKKFNFTLHEVIFFKNSFQGPQNMLL